MKNANYDILETKNYQVNEKYANGICLGKHPSVNCPQRYVTWEYTENLETGAFSFYWGHYYENGSDAYKDYFERLASHYDKPWEDM